MTMKSNAIKKHGKRGGRRENSGRKPGVKNRVTRALKEMANEYTERALKVLVDVMEDPEAPHAARVAAADKILDRGHGRPAIHLEPTNLNITPIPYDELREITRQAVERAAQRHKEIIEGRYERLGIKREYQTD